MNRRLFSAYLGNFFEHYDSALFGFLSPFLAPLLFPGKDTITALLLTYAMIPLGMMARPFGAIVFGRIGDTHGRERALFLSMLGMAVTTGCMALCPTYEEAGRWVPFIFFFGRLLQNFLSAGETVGGAIFILESCPEKNHDLHSGFFSASTIGGYLLAGGGVAAFSYLGIIETGWGWRLLYGLGCLTALFGCIIRRGANSSSLPPKRTSIRLGQMLWQSRQALITIMFCSGLGYATYSIALILLNGLIPLVSTYTKEDMALLNTILLVIDFAALPFFGWLSSKIGREKLMISAAWTLALTSVPLFSLVEGGSFTTIVIVRTLLVLLGVAFYAPFYAWASSLLPPERRYLILGFGYAVGSQLIGGPTAPLSLWFFKQTHMVSSAAWYVSVLAAICAIYVAAVYRKRVRQPLWMS